MIKKILFLTLVVLVSGCVSYSAVRPGLQDYSGLKVRPSQSWNLAPKQAVPASRSESKVLTQDGLLLDRLLIIPAVPSGESIFKSASKGQGLPEFKSDMLPNEIEELTETSIVKLFGESQVIVETSNLRPHSFGDIPGFLFDMEMSVSDGPNYGGVTGAFVSSDHLYLLIYLAAKPYYFEKHKDEALLIIRGASI